jgi:hypothetical protein
MFSRWWSFFCGFVAARSNFLKDFAEPFGYSHSPVVTYLGLTLGHWHAFALAAIFLPGLQLV